MPKGKITVHRKAHHRKGYHRKAYTRSDGTRVSACYVPPTRVKASTYKTKDRGAPGKGPKKVPITKKHKLTKYGYGMDKSEATRHKALDKAVKKYGSTKVYRRLLALRQVRERPAGEPGPSPPPKNTKIGKRWRHIDEDMQYVKKKYKPKLTPKAAIKKWKSMSEEERKKAMPGG